MRMNRWGVLTLGILLLAVLLTLASSVQARSVRDGHDTSASHVIRKRNAWWSKRDKSIDDSPRISSSERANDVSGLQTEDAPAIDCYTETCVPEFVVCTARSHSSRRSTDFLQCKLELRLCAKRCFDDTDMARRI